MNEIFALQIMPSLVRVPCVVPSNCLVTSSDTPVCEVTPFQERNRTDRPEIQAGIVCRCPAYASVRLSVSYPVLRFLAQRIFISMYQSSIKLSEVKEKAVQPCIKEKDSPSAEDRTGYG